MKTLKKLTWLLLLPGALAFSGCSKTDDVVAPKTLSEEVSGNYDGNKLTIAGKDQTIPANGLSVEMAILPRTDSEVNGKLTYSLNGKNEFSDIEASLSRNSDGSIDITQANTRIGTYKSGTITINSKNASGVAFTLTATKR
ncbi:MAG: hypothetical protein LH606_13545 [Cytophagaceae bacterium]|nr:hypothetical protein [Cytophagaceae bacterium]